MTKYRQTKREHIEGLAHVWYENNKDKHAAYMKFYHYGITKEERDSLFEKQGGRCPICGRHQSEVPQTFAVDHDHKNGKIRGLLCNSCNRGIGYLQDSVEICVSAAEYLRNK
jgi:hypothetical protein